jgi:DNA-directed RNA polymerase subunit RPC12/RpoP
VSCEPPRRVTLVRCPECGSTDAGADESQSAYDFTYMRCNECGHGGFADHWQIRFDWNVEGELIGDELPEYLQPLAPGEDLVSSLASERTKTS